jgi:AraC-like DNA-binding protein
MAREVTTARILPDGCVDLIWSDGRLMVAGPDTTAFISEAAPGTEFAGVRFAPGTGPAILGIRADEVRDRRVLVDDLLPTALARRISDQVEAQLRGGPVIASRVACALEFAATDAYRSASRPDPSIGAILSCLRGGSSVADTAASVGLNERVLYRRCVPAFGYGPKTLARILRLGRALDLARAGMPFAAVAATAGYADQPHLARDVRALAGASLGSVLSAA